MLSRTLTVALDGDHVDRIGRGAAAGLQRRVVDRRRAVGEQCGGLAGRGALGRGEAAAVDRDGALGRRSPWTKLDDAEVVAAAVTSTIGIVGALASTAVAALVPLAVAVTFAQSAVGVDRLGGAGRVGVGDGQRADLGAGRGGERQRALAGDRRDVLAGALEVDVGGKAELRGAEVVDARLDRDQVGACGAGAGDPGDRGGQQRAVGGGARRRSG